MTSLMIGNAQLIFLGDKIEKNEFGCSCSAYGKRRSLCRVSGEKWRKKLLGRRRHKWEDNVEMDLQDVGFGRMDWIKLDQDRDSWRALVKALMNIWVE